MRELRPGALFAGHRIEELVGRGGMGVVYRATQLTLDRTVALKVIAPDLLQDERARRRFLQECRIAASIDHAHVIPIYHAGEEAGVPYLAMRYVSGDDGRTLVRREGPLAPDRAAMIVMQVAGALDAAHAAGLVHRDVKPANVLLTADDHAYLSDFGLTRRVTSTSGATRTGSWVGTLDYVAPEQIRGDGVDARADVYALGGVLFFLLAAGVPFPREDDEAKLWAHLTEPPPAVSSRAPGVGEAFDGVIRRALAKAPDDRYLSAGDLGRAAVAAAAGVPVAEPERSVARGAAATAEAPTATMYAAPRRRPRRGTLALAGATVAAVAGAGLLLNPFANNADTPDRRRAPSPSALSGPPVRSATGRVAAEVPFGSRPNSLAPAGRRIWVGAWRTGRLAAIDTETSRTLRGLRPPVAGGTADMVATDEALWVATRAGQVLRLHPRHGRQLAEPVTLAMRPSAIAVRRKDVWIAQQLSGGPGEIVRIDATTGVIEAAAPATAGIEAMLYARGRLWTVHGDPNRLTERDPVTLRPIELIAIPGSSVGGLAFGAGALWTTVTDQDQLVRYQPHTGNRATVSIGARPAGVTVRRDEVWVAASGSSTVERVAARSLRSVGDPIRVPLNPLAITATDDAIWVTCVGENVVARIPAPY
jgi:hypothetical protein